jgi:hypothetical protein
LISSEFEFGAYIDLFNLLPPEEPAEENPGAALFLLDVLFLPLPDVLFLVFVFIHCA